MKLPQFDDKKYSDAIKVLGEQLAAMVMDDGGDEDMLEDYIADTVCQIKRAASKVLNLE